MSRIVRATSGRERMRYVLLAATGMRLGEEMALDVTNVIGHCSTVQVRHSIWRNHMGKPKQKSVRDIDLCADVAALMKS